MTERAQLSNYVLAGGTLLAALFVAVQAWYARVAYVEASETRFLERKLDLCFENFDQAAALDRALRAAVPGMASQEIWPPRVVVDDAAGLDRLQAGVVPALNDLESGLTKASVLGGLDKYRAYLQQEISGLSKGLLDLTPAALGQEPEALRGLSEFIGAQYSVFTGCRLIAEGRV